jgi:hypothetical protein
MDRLSMNKKMLYYWINSKIKYQKRKASPLPFTTLKTPNIMAAFTWEPQNNNFK